jgi:hypothetical protein
VTFSDMQRLILDLAVEDSYSLPELVARALGVQPGGSKGEWRKIVQACTREMFESGLLEVTRLEEPGGSEVALDHDAAEQSLADDLEWVDGSRWRPHVRVVATQQGRDKYYESS